MLSRIIEKISQKFSTTRVIIIVYNQSIFAFHRDVMGTVKMDHFIYNSQNMSLSGDTLADDLYPLYTDNIFH